MEKISRALIIFLVILGFLTGVLGGVGGVALVANSSTLQKILRVESSNGVVASSSRVENITVKEDSAVVSAVEKYLRRW